MKRALLLILLFCVSTAFGQDKKNPPPERKDGPQKPRKNREISKETWMERGLKRFKKMDKDGDGKLGPKEMRRMMGKRRKMGKGRKGRPDGFNKGAGGRKGRKNDRTERRKKIFDRMDGNKDGKISKEEWKGPPPLFKHLDKNGDGFVTREEIMEARKNRKGKKGGRFKKIDTDGDGKISREEFLAGHLKLFKKLDKNGDGKLDRKELRPLRRFMKRKGKGNRKMMKRFGEIFKRLDKNGDGVVSKEEVPERARAHFGRLDKNGDGKITREEFIRAFRKRMKRRGGPGGRKGPGRRKGPGGPEKKPENDKGDS